MAKRPGGRVRRVTMTVEKFEDISGRHHDTREEAERATFVEDAKRAASLGPFEDVDEILECI